MSEVTAQQGQIGSEADADEVLATAVREQAAAAAAGTPGIDQDAIVNRVLEGLTPRINSLLDTRVSGFQKLLEDERREKTALAEKLREFEVAGLSEDERAQLQQKERDEEMERLRLENELYQLAEQHPRGAIIYRRLIEPDLTAAQQVALLEELLPAGAGSTDPAASQAQGSTTQQGGGTEASGAVPVDRNNPAHQLSEGTEVLENGEIMSDEVADRILATAQWKQT